MINHSEKIEQVLRHEDKHPAAAISTPQRKEEFRWCKLEGTSKKSIAIATRDQDPRARETERGQGQSWIK
jgi:hypothetical protein